MARWVIMREVDRVQLVYHNLVTKKTYPLGESTPSTPDGMILEWICDHGRPVVGDQIQLSDGSRIMYASA
jgi:hypothetical protein